VSRTTRNFHRIANQAHSFSTEPNVALIPFNQTFVGRGGSNGDGLKTVIIEELMTTKKCVESVAKNAIKDAINDGLVKSYDDDKPNPNGGSRKNGLRSKTKNEP
jgi:hypothetical protein